MKPSMTTCPVSVPVIAEFCPEASNATAKRTLSWLDPATAPAIAEFRRHHTALKVRRLLAAADQEQCAPKNQQQTINDKSSRKLNIWIHVAKANSCGDFLRIRPINLSWLWNRRMQIQIMGAWRSRQRSLMPWSAVQGSIPLFLGNEALNKCRKIRLSNQSLREQKQAESLIYKVHHWWFRFFHHRTESAVKVGLQKRKGKNNSEESERFLAILFPENELAIWEYNRVVNVPIPDHFFDHLAEKFHIEKPTSSKPSQKGTFYLYLGHEWFSLTIKEAGNDAVESLDVSLLQKIS